jgi:hypothetical protein
MKRLILLLSVLLCALTLKAQVPTQVVTSPGSTYVYVGSLIQNQYDSGNSQKIVIKIFGGSWFADSNGETSYYISNRDGLDVRTVSIGSSTAGRVVLRAYQNGGNIDFFLVPTATDYSSFSVSSYTYGYAWTPHYFEIYTQATVPAITDITASLNIKPIMVTDPAGNIGIGVADTHGYKLGVNGNVHAKQVTVDMNDWADYVFNDDYRLMPLAELKKYLNQHRHLPDLPSTEQVTKNGVDLGQMNKLLLKKIEELSLHLIEKDAQLSEQREVNSAQQKDINQLKEQMSAVLKKQ